MPSHFHGNDNNHLRQRGKAGRKEYQERDFPDKLGKEGEGIALGTIASHLLPIEQVAEARRGEVTKKEGLSR